jgi:hypothetical protein
LNLDRINKVIAGNSAPILRRLKNFGILNTEFSDYTDTKLDYLLNILLQDLYLSLSDKELTEVKNFNSLRSCLMKVETLLDPAIAAGNDIADYVKDNRICAASTILSLFSQLTEEGLLKWAEEYGSRNRIVLFRDEDGITYLIDGNFLLPRLEELHNQVLYQQEKLASLSHYEKEKLLDEIGLLCNAGKNLLQSQEKLKSILDKDESINQLHQIITEYDDYQNSLALGASTDREERADRKRRGILETIGDFFMSLFSPRKEDQATMIQVRPHEHEPEQYKPVATGEAKNIVYKINNSTASVIPLSSYIDLLPANEEAIDAIINDIRKLNLKIVIPIFNARKVIYPNRSQQYLIPDIEYILVDTEVAQTPESVRVFTDSLAGVKIKDEKLTSPAILTIEKYLLTTVTQRKAQMIKKGKANK